ncbi:MAG: trigger factor [Clostridia bacterium]|nr:trigger factor [Clostridia bacterium]
MSVKIEKLEGSKVKLDFVVEKEKFNEALDQAFKENAGKFKMPGFRNGKVPRNVIEKTYGDNVLFEEAFGILAEKEYMAAVIENNLEVVSEPRLAKMDKLSKTEDIVFSIEVFVKPEAKLKKYKGLTIEKVNTEVTDADVDAELENMRNKNARIVAKEEGAVENGDIANIDFEGFLDGVAFDGGKAEKYDLEIGSGSFIPGFEEQIVGMKVGDEKDITTTFPEEYGNQDLAGKETIFKIKLHEIKKKELPALDDEFAKDVSEFDTLVEYKNSLKEKLAKNKEAQAKAERESKAIEALVAELEVEIPEVMVHNQIHNMIHEFEQNLAYQGMTLDQYMEILGIDHAALHDQFKDSAIKDIKLNLAMEQVVKAENVEVTDEEVVAKVEELCAAYGQDASSMKENENVKEYMRTKLKQEKAMNVVVENVKEK